ncbi:MAG: hypothetical protein O6928_04245, partial [Gammaproteobacteria bacterium]|nr:hypothetical protein [Gammaproteobacteria bacterium]
MTDKKEKVAIKMAGGKDIEIENNISIGHDKFADIGEVDGFKAKGNVSIAPSDRPTKDTWYKRPI